MLSNLPQTIQDEVTHLTAHYGLPIMRTITLGANKLFDPLSKKDRYGEVCMVVRRPNGRLLTMKKTFYPKHAYRLLTGGINHDEAVFAALLRETQEETGLQVEVRRFLAVASYQLAQSTTPVFYTFAFLLDEVGGTLETIDEDEQVEGFLEILPDTLPALAQQLHDLGTTYSPQINGHWADWGQFRAAIHTLVWEALNA